MGGIYIRIPLHKRLVFPKVCPFSGKPNPTGFVHVRHPVFQWRMPIPFIGGLWTKPITRVRFPATSGKALLDRTLKISIVCFWVVVIIAKIFGEAFLEQEKLAHVPGTPRLPTENVHSTFWVKVFLIGLGLTAICKLIRHANLQAVRIIDADVDVAELQFSKVDYAKEFAEQNQLHWHEKPFKKRYAREKR